MSNKQQHTPDMSTENMNQQLANEDRETNKISDEQMRKLFRLNMITAVLHLVTGVIIFGITDTKNIVPVTTSFPNPDNRGKDNWLPSGDQRQYNAKVGYFSGVFLLLAFADHFIVALIARSTYEYYLRRSQNHFRWFEYSISASFMHVMIAMLSGVVDIHIQYAIYGLTFTTMIFGSEQERTNWMYQGSPYKKSMKPFWYGFIPHMFNWTIILCYFFTAVSRGDPPGFVWAIIFILFILDASFAVNMYLQQKEIGKWRDYYYGEVAFIVLSLTSKQLLAWLNYGGSRSLSNN